MLIEWPLFLWYKTDYVFYQLYLKIKIHAVSNTSLPPNNSNMGSIQYTFQLSHYYKTVLSP